MEGKANCQWIIRQSKDRFREMKNIVLNVDIIALYMLRFGRFYGKIYYSVKIFVETVGKDE